MYTVHASYIVTREVKSEIDDDIAEEEIELSIIGYFDSECGDLEDWEVWGAHKDMVLTDGEFKGIEQSLYDANS